jgi:hypothetical protein
MALLSKTKQIDEIILKASILSADRKYDFPKLLIKYTFTDPDYCADGIDHAFVKENLDLILYKLERSY